MNHTRKVHGGGHAARESRSSAKRTQLNASIAIASLGWLVACGSSSPPSTAPSGTSSGTSSGAASSGAGTGTSTGASAGVGSGSMSGSTSGATSGTSLMDATMPTGDAAPEASTDDSSTPETGPAAPTGEAGEACNPGGTCGAGLACSNSICLPSGDAGEPCNADMSCAVGLACSSLSITCVPSGDAGEPCGPGNTCDNGLYCAVANGVGTCTVSTCAGQSLKPLPYSIAADFDVVYSLTNGPQDVNFSIINNLDCDTTTFAPIPNTGSADAGISDAGDAGADADAGFPTLNDGAPQFMTYATPPPCYEFFFDPSCTTEAACGWAGAIFTTSAALGDAAADAAAPQANAAGVCIAPGATMVTFQARASLNGTLVKFGSTKSAQCVAGGDIPIASDPVAQQTACAGDTEFWLALTNDWATYTVSIPAGEQYNDEPMATQGVWNGFSAVFEPEYAVGGTYVFVRNITWTNAALTASDAGDAASTADAPSDTGSDSSTDAPSE
jgi:hypothetical protein